MSPRRAYLDYNASAPLLPAAREAVVAALDLVGNASSVHQDGRAARRLVEAARSDVASLVGGQADKVVFTSGATEAASMLLSPRWMMGRGEARMSRVFVAASDHPCILGGGRFARGSVSVIGVDSNGVLDLGALEAGLAAHDRADGMAMVAVHLANNETGVIQPAPEIVRLARAAGALTVLDAVQAVGRIPVDIGDLCADFLILSSHKLGGPKGAGAIVAASDLLMPAPLVSGGGQEKGHRAGTENVAAIAGFGAAAAAARDGLSRMAAVRAVRDDIEARIVDIAGDATIFGLGAERLPNTSFFAVPGIRAETAQIAFDLAGVSVSAGSACSSGRVGPSHVLKAMGHGDDAAALRVSIGSATTADDVALFAEALAALVSRHAGRKAAAA